MNSRRDLYIRYLFGFGGLFAFHGAIITVMATQNRWLGPMVFIGGASAVAIALWLREVP